MVKRVHVILTESVISDGTFTENHLLKIHPNNFLELLFQCLDILFS